jgi:Ni/Fe-hydrogenase subunit HybB-like protein
MVILVFTPEVVFTNTASTDPVLRNIGLILMIIFIGVAVFAFLVWLKPRPITATVIAAALVVVGMWLERWNIIVPTMTHPRLIGYSIYLPTVTEVALTAASIALFIFMFLVFFKLFPAISIWEVAEGRVISKAEASVEFPKPEPSEIARRLRRWGLRG